MFSNGSDNVVVVISREKTTNTVSEMVNLCEVYTGIYLHYFYKFEIFQNKKFKIETKL